MMTQACLEVLREQEELLRFQTFGSTEALALGNAAAELAKEYERGISVSIVREKDNLILFQYAMDDKTPENLVYMEGKRKAARMTGHCSLWPYVEYELTGKWKELEELIPKVLPVGGAFPIRAGGQWVATLMISGLHDGKDHELAVRALSRILQIKVPEFPGKAV